MNDAVPQRTWWLAFALVCSVTVLLSFIAYSGHMPQEIPEKQLDKGLHFAIGGGLAATLDGALRRRNVRSVPLAAIVVVVPAAIEEWAQRFSTSRTSSLGDFVADVTGVVCCIWLGRRFVP